MLQLRYIWIFKRSHLADKTYILFYSILFISACADIRGNKVIFAATQNSLAEHLLTGPVCQGTEVHTAHRFSILLRRSVTNHFETSLDPILGHTAS